MADVNINAPVGQAPAMAPLVRTDDQILPRIRWVPIAKSNCYLDLDKSQINPIYKIAVDLLKHTNFFRAFTATSTIPSIYIQQFWDTVLYDKSARGGISSTQDLTLRSTCTMKSLFLDISSSVQRVQREKSSGCLFMVALSPQTYKRLHTTRNIWQRWPSIDGIWPVKQGVIRNLLHQSPLSLPGCPSQRRLRHLKASVSTPIISAQPAPTSTLAKPQEKKHKQTTETSDKPFKAKKSKYGFVGKKRTLKSVAESVAEDAPAKEPRVAAEYADMQKALEESLKSVFDVPRGPLPPVVIREPESGKYQPLLEEPGKGKAKVTEEHVAHDLLSLKKPKKKIHVDQYIFHRHTSTPTGSSEHDETSYAKLGQSNSEEESKKVVPRTDVGGQGEGQAGPDPGTQAEGHSGPYVGAQDEGQAGSNPDEQSEGQAGPDPGFTAMAYPKVQENLKLTIEKQVLLEEPASSSGTLSSLQHLSKDISFGDLFFSDKPSKADNDKATVETKQFKATAIETTTKTMTLPPPPYQQQSTAEAMMMKRIDELEHIMANLIQENKGLEERLEKHGACLYTLEQLDIPH
nr:hypothetical protein [Tanacetum cinerariifolium]